MCQRLQSPRLFLLTLGERGGGRGRGRAEGVRGGVGWEAVGDAWRGRSVSGTDSKRWFPDKGHRGGADLARLRPRDYKG